jgi:chemotaxis response regulator CheB
MRPFSNNSAIAPLLENFIYKTVAPNKKKSPATKEVKEAPFPVVAIGASAGGLDAMMELLKYLPANTGMAFMALCHLPWVKITESSFNYSLS